MLVRKIAFGEGKLISMLTLNKLTKELKALASPSQADILQRFFKTAPGQYGAGDVFLGLRVPVTRLVARKYQDLSLADVRTLLASRFHEFRLAAVLILVAKYEAAETKAQKKKIVNFYLSQARRINNWDLVDLSADRILGDYLWEDEPSRKIWDKLIKSSSLWERRMAIVSTFAFIKRGRFQETFKLSRQLLNDRHDLIHKATGWMLREVGKRVSQKELRSFLNQEVKNLPRTALRYALEHFSKGEREKYLKK